MLSSCASSRAYQVASLSLAHTSAAVVDNGGDHCRLEGLRRQNWLDDDNSGGSGGGGRWSNKSNSGSINTVRNKFERERRRRRRVGVPPRLPVFWRRRRSTAVRALYSNVRSLLLDDDDESTRKARPRVCSRRRPIARLFRQQQFGAAAVT